jgi:hypothetical protein
MKSITILILAFVTVTVSAHPISIVEPHGLSLKYVILDLKKDDVSLFLYRESINAFLAKIRKPEVDTKHPENGQRPADTKHPENGQKTADPKYSGLVNKHHGESLDTQVNIFFKGVGYYFFEDFFWGRDLEATRGDNDEPDARDHHDFGADDGLEDCDFDDELGGGRDSQHAFEARDFDDDLEAQNLDLEARDNYPLNEMD